MKSVYMSVEEGFEHTPPELYRTSKQIIKLLNEKVNLTLVHPKDYNSIDNTIEEGFGLEFDKLVTKKSKHEPQGDLFIIYGDETSKNIGKKFAENQYLFLKNMRNNGNFSYFLNTPQAEENTMKDKLVELAKLNNNIAKTYYFESLDQMEYLMNKFGAVVLKPIFGCRGSGVQLIENIDMIEKLQNSENKLFGEYILQEPLEGDEKRIVLLEHNLLASRVHQNRETPWKHSSNQKTFIYKPSKKEMKTSKKLSYKLDLTIAGVDFIGDKINEINGTGTGLIMFNHNGELLYDKTPEFVNYVMRLIG